MGKCDLDWTWSIAKGIDYKDPIHDGKMLIFRLHIQFIGRGDVEGSFVRREQQTGSVEITIKIPSGDVTIRRDLTRGQKGGPFSMNGVRKTNKEIEQFVTRHNIVLENLCNFLLQEKVKDFGTLAGEPAKLLRHLEAAVGPPGMLDDHENLIALAGRKNDCEREHREKQEQLAHKQSQKASMREEIARLDQLIAIQESIHLLELKIPMLKVRRARHPLQPRRPTRDSAGAKRLTGGPQTSAGPRISLSQSGSAGRVLAACGRRSEAGAGRPAGGAVAGAMGCERGLAGGA
jgi:hypothetical protein